ncbi:MAG: FliH/SctL family protein [Chlamydiota bacterium]
MTLFSLVYKGAVKKTSPNKILRADEFSQLVDIKQLLQEAHQDIQKLHEDTEQECAKLKIQAEEEGFQEGLVKWNTQLIYLDQKVKEMQHEMQKLILPIALKASKKIVGAQLDLNPDTIVEIVQQALKPVRQSHEIKIFVSKEDKEQLETNKEKLKALFDQLRILVIEEKDDLTKGSCIIETETGIINASLDNQWKALEAAFETFLKR